MAPRDMASQSLGAPQAQGDGGPAFPQGNEWMDHEGNLRMIHQGGMTLRDYFAAAAVDAVIGICGLRLDEGPSKIVSAEIAEHAYAIADAMLRERSR